MKDSNILEHPLRIAAIQFEQNPEDTMKIPGILAQYGFNTEQLLHVVGHEVYGLYEKQKHKQMLQTYLQESAKYGTKIILYANAHMIYPETLQAHPDWAQRDASGSTVSAYGTYVFACINGPWKKFFLTQIRDSLEQNIQGIFLDGPNCITEGCRCVTCKKLFQQQFGHSMESASSLELSMFKQLSVATFVRDVRSEITQSGKSVVLYANSIGLTHNVTGCTIDAVSPYVDIFGTEGGFLFYGNPNHVSIWRGSESAKYLEGKSDGKPCVIFNAGNHQPWAREMHTAAETIQLFASTVANGAYVWYGIHGQIDDLETEAGKNALSFNRFLADHEEYFTGTRPYTEIALLWSQRTADLFPSQVEETDFTGHAEYEQKTAGSFQKEFQGFAELLFRTHSQFAIIGEEKLTSAALSSYKILILPNVCCLNKEAISVIREFANNGGTVIATLETGMYDENGTPYSAPSVFSLFGITERKEIIQNIPGCSYMQIVNPVTDSESTAHVFAGFCSGSLNCAFTPDCQILVNSFFPMEGRYNYLSNHTYPGIISRRLGIGNVIYISGGFGETCLQYGIPELRNLFRDLTQKYSTGYLSVNNVYSSVEVELRLQPDQSRYLLHFVNHTGQMQRPMESLLPCRGIQITMQVSSPVHRVYTLYAPKNINFNQNGNSLSFAVDVGDYELVVIDYSASN